MAKRRLPKLRIDIDPEAFAACGSAFDRRPHVWPIGDAALVEVQFSVDGALAPPDLHVGVSRSHQRGDARANGEAWVLLNLDSADPLRPLEVHVSPASEAARTIVPVKAGESPASALGAALGRVVPSLLGSRLLARLDLRSAALQSARSARRFPGDLSGFVEPAVQRFEDAIAEHAWALQGIGAPETPLRWRPSAVTGFNTATALGYSDARAVRRLLEHRPEAFTLADEALAFERLDRGPGADPPRHGRVVVLGSPDMVSTLGAELAGWRIDVAASVGHAITLAERRFDGPLGRPTIVIGGATDHSTVPRLIRQLPTAAMVGVVTVGTAGNPSGQLPHHAGAIEAARWLLATQNDAVSLIRLTEASRAMRGFLWGPRPPGLGSPDLTVDDIRRTVCRAAVAIVGDTTGAAKALGVNWRTVRAAMGPERKSRYPITNGHRTEALE